MAFVERVGGRPGAVVSYIELLPDSRDGDK